jgi:hypothetical protein
MRSLLIISAFIAHAAIAASVSFPPAISPEQPASDRVFGAAAGNQHTLAIASNGQIGFAVWLDQRRGATDLYGSRVGTDGVSLDPLGILIATGVTGGSVVWNGTSFVVISERGSDKTFSFVTPDGIIIDHKTMLILYNQFAATLGSGPDARILFVGYGEATILDSQANLVMAGVQLVMPPFESLRVAGSGGSEFLILHTMPVPGRHLFADRIDRDGKFLGTADTGLDLSVTGTTLALAGGPDEYLLVSRGRDDREVIWAHLDHNGVAKGVNHFAAYDATLRVSYPPAKPAITRELNSYGIAWTTSEQDGSGRTWWALQPAIGDTPEVPPVAIFNWTGTGYGVTLADVGSSRVIVTDVLRSAQSTSIDPVVTTSVNTSHPTLASTATSQTTPQVASSANGYALIWNEFGPDGSSHLYLRRFSQALSGGPLELAPIEVASDTGGHAIKASIAASGATYVIAWSNSSTLLGDDYVVRRFSATTGGWLDAQPVPLVNAKELVLGSNGDGALAVYTVNCPSQDRCLRARAIATDSGAPLRSNETVPAGIKAYGISIASNGHDYLIAFNDNICLFPCDVPFPSRIVAQRLAADGKPIDRAPFVIDDTPNTFPVLSSVAWYGNYAVSWARNGSILGSHVSSNGVTDPAREIMVRPSILLSQHLVANGAGLLLLTTEQTGDVDTTSGVAVDPQSLHAIGEPALLVTDQPPNATVSAAALPTGVVIAYDRVEQAAANVGRVFMRAFGSIIRRRAAR